MKTNVLLMCLVIQFCVATSLPIQTNTLHKNLFHPRTNMETKLDLSLERNVPKVTLEWINRILYFIIAEPSKAFLPWSNRQPVPAVPLTNTTNQLNIHQCADHKEMMKTII